MKKILSLLLLFVLLLAACSSGESTATKDGKVAYKGEISATDDKGVTTVTTVSYDKSGEDITNVVINSTKGDVDKRSSDYGLVGESTGLTWGEQADAVAKSIEENDAFPTVNGEGKATDAVSNATITVSDMQEAFANAKAAK